MTLSASPWEEIAAGQGEVRWSVAPGLRDQLLGPSGLRLAEWLQSGQALVVKAGPHRVVYRVHLSCGTVVYVKHNLLPDVRAWCRQLVRPSKARMELDRALAVAACGVATVEPLALGERQTLLGSCDSYLITRSLDGTETLNTMIATTLAALPAPRQAVVRQRLAVVLGRFVARLHDAGIRHGDFHAANILVRLGADDQPELFLIDLNGVQVGPRLAWRGSRDNLVMLAGWFTTRASRADRLRFWRAYFEARGLGRWQRGGCRPQEPLGLARELESRARARALNFWRGRDRRCLVSNRYYRRLRAPGVRGYAVADLGRDTLTSLVANPDAAFGAAGVRLLKDSRSSTVAELEIVHEGRPCRVIYKRFAVTAWSDPVAALVRPTAALRSWKFGHGLRERCLPTARPLLVLHRLRAGMACEGYLLCEKIEDAVDLHAFLASLAQRPVRARPRALRGAIDAVARVVRRLHRCRLSHRDLKASNLLIAADPDCLGSPFQPIAALPRGASLSSLLPLPASPVWFIDLVGVRLHAHLSRRRRWQNLARLNASFHQSGTLSRTDKLRFLRAYLLWNLKGKGAWKVWWRGIAAATADKVARNARNGRVLA
jgi:tRNA A-37 threonylcarbamoyl transferase component Bud32